MSLVHRASVKLNNMTWHTKTACLFIATCENEAQIKENELEGIGACLILKKKV